mgnify:CR=1 FL=1
MKKGFTLLELLLVVAIIGILSSVILTALATARNRANDAKVKAHLSQAKAAAEIYSEINNGYGSANVSVVTGGTSCTGVMFTDTVSGMAVYGNSTNYPGGTRLVCVQNLSAFAFAASLSSAGRYWCVDSTGDPGEITISNPAAIVAADDTCVEMDLK